MKHCQNIKLVEYPNYSLMPLYVLFYWESGKEQIIFKSASLAKQVKLFYKKSVTLSHMTNSTSKATETPPKDTHMPN